MKLGKSMNYVTKKSSLFAKMNGLIALLFIPILALYTYSN